MRNQVKYFLVLAALALFTSACKTHRANLPIESVTVSFLGGNNYQETHNTGGFAIYLKRIDTISNTLKKFDVYSPSKKPILISVKKENDLVIASDEKGNKLILGNLSENLKNCDYDCVLNFSEGDEISFTSSLALFRYWHGLSALGGLPLFMRYHYYTLKIKKKNGSSLKAEWKYSVYKYKPYNGKSRVWSGDYCEDSGGGLTKLRIR